MALDKDREAFIAALNEATPEVGMRLRDEVFDSYRSVGESPPRNLRDARSRFIEDKLQAEGASGATRIN